MEPKINIINGKINNLAAIIEYINKTNDYEYLRTLLDAIEEYEAENNTQNLKDFLMLKTTIADKLGSANSQDLDVKDILRKLCNDEPLSPIEYKKLTEKMEDIVERMNLNAK